MFEGYELGEGAVWDWSEHQTSNVENVDSDIIPGGRLTIPG